MIKLFIAFFLLLLGLTYVTDWIIFSVQPENEALAWEAFKIKYVERFPQALQPLIRNATLLTLIFMLCFVISALIFVNQKQKWYKVLGAFAFLMAGWQLFTLM